MESYSIGQLAKLADVPTSTIRFYERIGLIKPDFRTGGNYRGYNMATMNRLRFVRSAQATGLSLEDIEVLFELTQTRKPPCDEVQSLMRHRLDEIRQRLKDLRHVEKVLSESLHRCCKGSKRDICAEVCRISGFDVAPYKSPSKKHRQST